MTHPVIETMAQAIYAEIVLGPINQSWENRCKEATLAALRAAREAGWKLVPVTPSPEMVMAGIKANDTRGIAGAIMAALAAAPDVLGEDGDG